MSNNRVFHRPKSLEPSLTLCIYADLSFGWKGVLYPIKVPCSEGKPMESKSKKFKFPVQSILLEGNQSVEYVEELYLQGLCKCLSVLSSLSPSEENKEHMEQKKEIWIFTENLYIKNLLTEWLPVWGKQSFLIDPKHEIHQRLTKSKNGQDTVYHVSSSNSDPCLSVRPFTPLLTQLYSLSSRYTFLVKTYFEPKNPISALK
jgi:hypothetical protein